MQVQKRAYSITPVLCYTHNKFFITCVWIKLKFWLFFISVALYIIFRLVYYAVESDHLLLNSIKKQRPTMKRRTELLLLYAWSMEYYLIDHVCGCSNSVISSCFALLLGGAHHQMTCPMNMMWPLHNIYMLIIITFFGWTIFLRRSSSFPNMVAFTSNRCHSLIPWHMRKHNENTSNLPPLV